MTKLAALFVLLHLAACQYEEGQFFQDVNDINTVEGCSKLEGAAKSCLACYPCDHDRIKTTKKKVYNNLAFTFSNCSKNELCCIKTKDSKARSNDDSCGKHNPHGEPRSRRSSLRSVLEREYPWRAWVYSSISDKLLCAASYVSFGVKSLLATVASCVSDHQPSDIYVKFTKTQATSYRVNNIVTYDGFRTKFGGNLHDIALVMLSEKPDSHVKSVCLDKNPPLLGASCVIVSDSEIYINTVVPQLKKCRNDNVTIGNGVMCTYMFKGDHTPQKGAGLYCLNGHSATPTYTLHGIYQAEHSTEQVAVYTTVHKYANWVFKTATVKTNQPS